MRQLPSFSIFGHVTIIKRQGTRGPQDLLLAKDSFFSMYPSTVAFLLSKSRMVDARSGKTCYFKIV